MSTGETSPRASEDLFGREVSPRDFLKAVCQVR